MALKQRNGRWYAHFSPYGKEVGVVLQGITSEEQARRTYGALVAACKNGNFTNLDNRTRDACARLFKNQGWVLPSELSLERKIYRPETELTLWRAIQIFVTYPTIRDSKTRWRYDYDLAHIVRYFGKDYPIKELWVPDLRLYQLSRQTNGAASSTINWELATLSKLFGVLEELELIDRNPCRRLKRFSTKTGERQAYLSRETVERIAGRCPSWFGPIVWTAYFTGMRRGEIVELTRRQVNLGKRIIGLGPQDTKEGHWKRVPIHVELLPILREAMKVSSLESQRLFLLPNGKTPTLEAVKNPWPRACESLNLAEPRPRFHDLRHTWKTNARRSGMDPEIREAILGHSTKQRSVSERYGRISDEELIRAIDGMAFDHGETEILVARRQD